MLPSPHTDKYFQEVLEIAQLCNNKEFIAKVSSISRFLWDVRDSKGRVFVLGVGGSAGNASHMVNDLRKLCGIEAYSPVDNVSELTARTNDDGFETVFSEWLRTSKLNHTDAVLFLSVGGGSKERGISVNLINALDLAKVRGAFTIGIVGKADGYIAKNADIALVVPSVNPDRITPHSEAFQSIIWHCFVSNPYLQVRKTTW